MAYLQKHGGCVRPVASDICGSTTSVPWRGTLSVQGRGVARKPWVVQRRLRLYLAAKRAVLLERSDGMGGARFSAVLVFMEGHVSRATSRQTVVLAAKLAARKHMIL